MMEVILMSKPASLYPKPEPLSVDSRFIYLGCIAFAIVFFIVGWAFRNIGVFA